MVDKLTSNIAPDTCVQECMNLCDVSEVTQCVAPIPDEELSRVVNLALWNTGYPALRNVEIEISLGAVILWGRVPSYFQKQLAQSVIQHVEGVRGVANGLEVVCSR